MIVSHQLANVLVVELLAVVPEFLVFGLQLQVVL